MAIVVNNEVHDAFARLANLAQSTEVMNDIGLLMERSIQKNFAVGGRYGELDGDVWKGGTTKWAGLSGAYAAWRQKKGYTGGLLQVHGLLKNSITFTVTAAGELQIGSALEYASYLQYGTKNKDGSERMPARPIVVIQDKDMAAIEITIADYIASRA